MLGSRTLTEPLCAFFKLVFGSNVSSLLPGISHSKLDRNMSSVVNSLKQITVVNVMKNNDIELYSW